MSIYVAPKLPAAAKAGPIGPGAGVLLTELPLTTYGRITPQKKMQRAWSLSFEVPWIAAAEDAINERFSGVEWSLEDEQDNTIDDAYQNPDAQAARMLLEKPAQTLPVGAKFYRSDLWALTSRAMGICGSAFIYLDQPEALAGTPSAMVPIAPWRMFPDEDENNNLTGWHIDKTQNNPGIEVRIEQVLHYRLRPNFVGHFGVGLMESAMRKLQISQGLDDHVGMVLSAGGRLSGILSPQQGTVGPDEILQMERDWRTIVDQSDAAKRLQLVRAPIKFDRTTLTPAELQVVDLLKNARDDLLTMWGVPLSIIGGTTPAGLNSGDTRKYDEAAIWQGPVHHRLNVFRETTQYQLLDRFAARGATVELELDEPEFDDDSPRYDLLGKSVNTPMRNAERRALIGLPPLGDPALDNAIILPATIVPYADAPDESNEASPTAVVLGRAEVQVSAPSQALLAAGEQNVPEAKAANPRIAPLRLSLVRYRDHTMAKVTPLLKRTVGDVLSEQRRDIAAKLREHAEHLTKNRRDSSIWFDRGWDAKLRAVLAPRLEAVAHVVNAQIHDVLPAMPAKAGPQGAVERVLARGAARVKGINDTTRAKIQEAISRGLEEGLSVLEVADLIESGGEVADLSMGSLFDEYRAEMIARTELMDAYNASAIGSYSDAGITQVEAIDGDGDEECAARDGQTFSVEEADSIEDHPNGTLDWSPILEPETIEAKAIVPVDPWREAFMAQLAKAEQVREPYIVSPNITMNMTAAEAPHVEVHPPGVTINPEINVTTPDINVSAAPVMIEEGAVVVNLPPPEPHKPVIKRVVRNAAGAIETIVEDGRGQ